MIITFTNVIGAIRNAASEAAEVITSGLQMWLGFEESEVSGINQIVQDKSSNSNVASLFTGKALDFDGTNDNINIPSFSISGTRTFVIWFKSTSSLANRRLFNLVTDAGNCNVTLNNGVLNCYDGSNNPATSTTFNDGIWHRAVFVMVDGAFKIYVDGVSQTLTTTSWVNKTASSGQMRIGADLGSSGIDGQISSAEIYDVAWSQADVTYDYANPNKLVTTKTSPSISLSNLVGYWALSEGSGSTAYDSSGAGNNGTINGAVYVVSQQRIPQLSMQDFSQVTDLGATLIADPNNPTQDILGQAVRSRDNSANIDGFSYAQVNDDNTLDFGTGAFTLECWVKADFVRGIAGVNTIFSSGVKVNETDVFSIMTLSTNKFRTFIGGGQINSNDVFTVGNWYHLVVARKGNGACNMYVDKVAQTEAITNTNDLSNTERKYIGWDGDTTTDRNYKNLISDVRLYNRLLSQEEINNNYNAGQAAHTN